MISRIRNYSQHAIYGCIISFLFLPIFLFFGYSARQCEKYTLSSNHQIIVWFIFVFNVSCFFLYLWSQRYIDKTANGNDLSKQYLTRIKQYYLALLFSSAAVWIFFSSHHSITQTQLYAVNSILLIIDLILCVLLLQKAIVKMVLICNIVDEDNMLFTKLDFIDQIVRKRNRNYRFRPKHLRQWETEIITKTEIGRKQQSAVTKKSGKKNITTKKQLLFTAEVPLSKKEQVFTKSLTLFERFLVRVIAPSAKKKSRRQKKNINTK